MLGKSGLVAINRMTTFHARETQNISLSGSIHTDVRYALFRRYEKHLWNSSWKIALFFVMLQVKVNIISGETAVSDDDNIYNQVDL